MRNVLIVTALALLLLSGCTKEANAPPTRAFYHWQTALTLTPAERSYLDSLQVTRLYAKFFDVDWDEARQMAVPLAVILPDTATLTGLAVVPVVFITVRCLRQLEGDQFDTLATRIYTKLQALGGAAAPEVQLDCDWTDTTRDKYFRLLTSLRARLRPEQVLSTTVRLHQLRYPAQTGVPPADRGMLMCYNVGDLDDWGEDNSILSVEGARPYLESTSAYPLPLDLALPLFRWAIVYRDGRLVHLFNELGPEKLADTSRFVKLAGRRFEVTKSTYLDGYYLYHGDQIRTEAVEEATLKEISALAGPFLSRSGAVAFYHLDTATIKRYPYAVPAAIYEQF